MRTAFQPEKRIQFMSNGCMWMHFRMHFLRCAGRFAPRGLEVVFAAICICMHALLEMRLPTWPWVVWSCYRAFWHAFLEIPLSTSKWEQQRAASSSRLQVRQQQRGKQQQYHQQWQHAEHWKQQYEQHSRQQPQQQQQSSSRSRSVSTLWWFLAFLSFWSVFDEVSTFWGGVNSLTRSDASKDSE